tara:strand:+ start:35 stop:895 length:861 start_codon:yes stop_codon:yes gene_type:complete
MTSITELNEEMTSIPITTESDNEETEITETKPKKETKKSLKYDCLQLTFENAKLTTQYMEEKEADLLRIKELMEKVESLTKELEDAKKVKTTRTKRVKSDVVLTGEKISEGEYKYELTDDLANYLTRGDMNDEDYVKACKKSIYDGEKSPTLRDVYTYIYEGYTGREEWTTDEPTITITPTPEKKEVQNPKDLSKLKSRCECVVWSRRNDEDNRCKTEGVETYDERSMCKTHYKSVDNDRVIWNANGGDYDTQVGRFRDGYYDTFDAKDGKKVQKYKKTHNDYDTY